MEQFAYFPTEVSQIAQSFAYSSKHNPRGLECEWYPVWYEVLHAVTGPTPAGRLIVSNHTNIWVSGSLVRKDYLEEATSEIKKELEDISKKEREGNAGKTREGRETRYILTSYYFRCD